MTEFIALKYWVSCRLTSSHKNLDRKKEHKGLRQAQKLGDESNEKDAQWREKTNPFHKKCLLKNVPSYSNNWGLNRANDMTSGTENLRHGELNRRLFIIRWGISSLKCRPPFRIKLLLHLIITWHNFENQPNWFGHTCMIKNSIIPVFVATLHSYRVIYLLMPDMWFTVECRQGVHHKF